MQLYKMELYKLCAGKLFRLGAAGAAGVLLLTVLLYILRAGSGVNGMIYRGYEAIKKDREITEEFKGELSVQKIERIVERYGFPEQTDSANYLNDFISSNLGIRNLESYQAFREQFAEGDDIAEREITIEYYGGWMVFLTTFPLVMICVSIWIMVTISPVFSEEEDTGMKPLAFTTREGRKRDIIIKMAAGLTVTSVVYLAVTGLFLAVCGVVFGLEGLECFAFFYSGFSSWIKVSMMTAKASVGLILILAFEGQLLLCAITILVSACYQSTFRACVVDMVLWLFPLLFQIITGKQFWVVKVTPVYLIMPATLYEIRYPKMLPVMMAVAAGAAAACLFAGYIRYGKEK